MPATTQIGTDRAATIAAIRAALKRRTGHVWSVKGSTGTAWGWITVTTPPAHQKQHGRHQMSDGECIALAKVLGLHSVSRSGWSIPASSAYYRDAVLRAETGASDVNPQPYWD